MITGSSARRHTTRMAFLAGIAGVLSLIAGCVSDGVVGDGATPVTFQTSWVPSVQFGGTYLAQSKGYFSDSGVEVTILPGGPDVDTLAAVVSGQADIALENADTVARANENGAGLVIVAAGMPKNPLVILSTESNPINTPSDMEGKRIGVTTANQAVQAALVKVNGLDANKITTVPVGFDVAPLVSGEVDGLWAIYSSQPIAYESATGANAVTMLVADYGLDVYTQVYAVKKEFLADPRRKAAIEGFLKGEIRGWQDYVDDPTEAVEVTLRDFAKDGGLNSKDQNKQAARQLDLIVTDDTKKHGLLSMTEGGIRKNLSTLAALGITADESLFDTSVLSQIYAGKSTIG